MSPQNDKNIVEIAWSKGGFSALINTVNISIRLNFSSISKLVNEQ